MNDGSTRESLEKRLAQRAKVKQWFAERPEYQRNYAAKQKQLRDELGCSRNGTIPVKAQKKITYTVNVSRPLKPEERVRSGERRVHRDLLPKKKKRIN